HVIEDAGEQYYVPHAHRIPGDLERLDLHVFYLRAQKFACRKESFLRFSRHIALPDERVRGQHPAGAAALGFEGKEAVPCADIEERLSGQVRRQVNVGELLLAIAVSGRDHAVSKVNLVEPIDAGNPVLDELSGVSGVRHRRALYCNWA